MTRRQLLPAWAVCTTLAVGLARADDLASVTVDGWTIAVTKAETTSFPSFGGATDQMQVTLELAVDGPKATETSRLVELAGKIKATDNAGNVDNQSKKVSPFPFPMPVKSATLGPRRGPLQSLRRLYRLVLFLPDDRVRAIKSLEGDLVWAEVATHVISFSRAELVPHRVVSQHGIDAKVVLFDVDDDLLDLEIKLKLTRPPNPFEVMAEREGLRTTAGMARASLVATYENGETASVESHGTRARGKDNVHRVNYRYKLSAKPGPLLSLTLNLAEISGETKRVAYKLENIALPKPRW